MRSWIQPEQIQGLKDVFRDIQDGAHFNEGKQIIERLTRGDNRSYYGVERGEA